MSLLKPFVEVVMKTVALTQGFVALVDDEDFERVSQHKWRAMVCSNTVYAVRDLLSVKGKQKIQSMHRFVLGLSGGHAPEVDHEDHNGLNCQKYNLRTATRTQNQANAQKRIDNISGVKDVYWDKAQSKWRVQVQVNGKRQNVGRYSSLECAKVAAQDALIKHHGEFSCVG
jgi:hypothetical protein